MPRLFLIFIIVGLSQTLTGQFSADFSTDDLSDWQGDVSTFIVNASQQLQLNGSETSTAGIYTALDFSDSLRWSIDVLLDFEPSGSNSLVIWLAVDDFNSDNPTGYKLELGETGSNDAINFIWVDAGTENLIAQGDMGQVAEAFALQFIVTKDADDVWTLATRDLGSVAEEESFSVLFEDNFLSMAGEFGLVCDYTSSRATLFSFDNIRIEELLPDTAGPILVDITALSASKIELVFDEAIDESSLAAATFDFSSGNLVNTMRLIDPNRLCLDLQSPLPSDRTVTLTISGLTDLLGNEMESASFSLMITETPAIGDLIINELLYDPNSGLSADFVELKNISNKTLSLEGLLLARANSSANDVPLPEDLILAPGEIIAFTQDRQEIIDVYEPIPEANIIELGITNYVNDEGNVWLRAQQGSERITLDSLDYNNDFHSDLLTSAGREGVSIERLSGFSDTNDPDNWFSASSLNNYGTPGYENSQSSNPTSNDEQIELVNKVFTPNGDGFEDFTQLNFSFDKPGFVANLSIFDDHGRLQTRVAENKLLGTSGSIIWEGKLEDDSVAPVGIYIIYYDIFHSDGDVLTGKMVCVLSLPIN